MSFVFLEEPEEKYQTRTAIVHSIEYVRFDVWVDGLSVAYDQR